MSGSQLTICQLFGEYPPLAVGAGLRQNRLASDLRQKGCRVLVLTPRWEGTKAREVVNGTLVYRIPMPSLVPKWAQFLVFGLLVPWYILRQHRQFQILHSFSYGIVFIPSLLMAKWLGKPVIVESTLMKPDGKTRSLSLKDQVERRLLQHWNAYVGLSRPLIEAFLEAAVPREQIALLPPSVDTDLYRPAGTDERRMLRRAHGYGPEDIVICSVGSITPRKGTDILIRAFIRLARHSSEYRLLLIGKFDRTARARQFQDMLRCCLEDAGLTSRVRMTGFIGDQPRLIECLQLSDIFAFSSRREGLPNALLEAMAVGLPCVSAEMQRVVYDIIEPEHNGIVVRSYCPKEWAAAIQRLGEQRELRGRLGEAARNTVISKFGREAAVERQLMFYQRVLHNDGLSSPHVGKVLKR